MKTTCCLIIVGWVGWVQPVAAQPTERLSLTWTAPSGCPTGDDVQGRVDALLGGETSANTVADVRATGQVERVEGGYRLQLQMAAAGTPSSRTLEARSCDELAGAAAIAIALLARESSSAAAASSPEANVSPPSGSGGPGDANAPRQPEPSARAPVTSTSAPHSGTSSQRAQLVIDAPLGTISWGTLPETALGVGLAAGVRWKSLRVVAGAELWREQSIEPAGFAVEFALRSARLDACLTTTIHALELGACAGVAVEHLVAQGIASERYLAASATNLWVSGTGGILVALRVPGFSALRILGQGGVRVPTTRPRYVISQLGPVHQPALAAPKLDFGCEWIF
jgi:hypothetical protein